jgi:hypothetical protein
MRLPMLSLVASILSVLASASTGGALAQTMDDPAINPWQGEWMSADANGNWALSIKECNAAGRCAVDAFQLDRAGMLSCLMHGVSYGSADATERAVSLGGGAISLRRDGNSLVMSNGNSGRCEPVGPSEERTYRLRSKNNYIRIPKTLSERCYSEFSPAIDVFCTDRGLEELFEAANKIPLMPADYPWFWDSRIIGRCETADDIKRCLDEGYQAKFELLQKTSELYATAGDRSRAKVLNDLFAGVYKYREQGVDRVENMLEFVPVADFAAYIKVHLAECDIAGIAEYEKVDGFVFQDDNTAHSCLLTVTRKGESLALDDPNGGCSRYCGGGVSSLNQRRPIRYMPVILKSSEFQEALARFKERHTD